LVLVAVTTDTLLGVATPVIGGAELPALLVEFAVVLPDPKHPATRPAAATTQTIPQSLVRSLLNLMFNTSRLASRAVILSRCNMSHRVSILTAARVFGTVSENLS
jgi:hypothetical protein